MIKKSKRDVSPSSSESDPGIKRSVGRPKKSILKASLNAIHISDKDIIKWMQLVELRGSSNELYRMADRFQANLIITGLLTVQQIYKTVVDGLDGGEAVTLDQINKLTTSFNRAVASINQALSYLGVTGNKREEEPETDALADFLKKAHIEMESLPMLQTEFVSAQRDIDGMDMGGDPLDEANPAIGLISNERKRMITALKKPMKSYQEDEIVETYDVDKIIDVELDRSNTL